MIYWPWTRADELALVLMLAIMIAAIVALPLLAGAQTTAIRPLTSSPIIVCDEVDLTGTLHDTVEVCRK